MSIKFHFTVPAPISDFKHFRGDVEMAYEAMDAGIEPGGLRDINEVKILLCYLLKNAGKPLTLDSLNEILQKDGLVNYFEFAQSLHELALSGHVDLAQQDGAEYYSITKLGEATAATFERRLPLSVREKAVKAAVQLTERQRLEAENKVVITGSGNSFTVECRVLDGADELLAVRLLVPEIAQAQAVKEQFLKNPELIYKAALTLMTGDLKAFGALIGNDNEV